MKPQRTLPKPTPTARRPRPAAPPLRRRGVLAPAPEHVAHHLDRVHKLHVELDGRHRDADAAHEPRPPRPPALRQPPPAVVRERDEPRRDDDVGDVARLAEDPRVADPQAARRHPPAHARLGAHLLRRAHRGHDVRDRLLRLARVGLDEVVRVRLDGAVVAALALPRVRVAPVLELPALGVLGAAAPLDVDVRVVGELELGGV